MRRVKRSQPRLKSGTRVPRSTALTPEVDACIRADAREAGVSESWMSAWIKAQYYGITIPHWTDKPKKDKKRR